ncbi:hypothetical protein AVEN_183664-1 [Araneus ventricosus]|uniref:DUF4817 domain-containing protein n=1 Tax=Araneus ventricosus TaxID=182803 RepID=A0A4Y2B3K6_ARAVE|nr:hypothetical protein AVEN_116415-1 [Araneus ventricosus]GBL85912.1 hypothetical protein AVEN_183664-1 [Araneus ventricosus]
MASPQEQSQVVVWFIEFKSATQTQRKFRTTYNRSPSSKPIIYKWQVYCDRFVSGIVNRHITRVWGLENPHAVLEQARDSPKVNVWCGLLHDRIIEPFFLSEVTVRSVNYLDILEIFAFPQIKDLQLEIIFQQDGAHWSSEARKVLDDKFPRRWIGRGGPIPWLPRSPDITHLDFFLWGYVENIVYQSPIRDTDEPKSRITAAIQTVDCAMLHRTWLEIS